MSEGCSGGHAKSGSVGSSRGSTWGNKDIKDAKTRSVNERRNSLALERGHIKHTEQYQAPQGHGQFEKRDEEVERLHRLVRDLELEARGRC